MWPLGRWNATLIIITPQSTLHVPCCMSLLAHISIAYTWHCDGLVQKNHVVPLLRHNNKLTNVVQFHQRQRKHSLSNIVKIMLWHSGRHGFQGYSGLCSVSTHPNQDQVRIHTTVFNFYNTPDCYMLCFPCSLLKKLCFSNLVGSFVPMFLQMWAVSLFRSCSWENSFWVVRTFRFSP